MSEKEQLIDNIEQALAEQEENLRAEAVTRKALISEPEPMEEPEPDLDDFMEIDPWENVYRPRARERRQRRRGEEVALPYDKTNTAPRPRQRVLEHREKQEEKRIQKKRVKEQDRKKAQEQAAEAVDDLTLWQDETSRAGRKLSRKEARRKRIIEEQMMNDDPYGREWLTPDETRAIEHREELRRSKTGKRQKKKRRPGRIVLLVILIIIAALVASGFGLYFLGKKNLTESNISSIEMRAPEGAGASGGVISFDGTTYHYNENLINLLIFGVGHETLADGSERVVATGVFLWSYDTEKKTSRLVPVPAHLMTDCPVFDDSNEFLHMNDQQLALSYASGGTTELMRYQNVVNSVSNLLYGAPVSAYLVIDMEHISEMNDMVGGVTLRVLEDLTEYDAALIGNEQIDFTGSQAAIYVNERSVLAESEFEAENGLLSRQQQYMQGYLTTVKTAIFSPSSIKAMLEMTREYTYSDMELPELVYMSVTLLTNNLNDNVEALPINEEQAASTQELRVDQDALFSEVLTLFYHE